MIGSEVAAGRLVLPNGLPDFVVEAPDGADPYPPRPPLPVSAAYPRLSDRLLRAAHRLNGVGVCGTHQRKSL